MNVILFPSPPGVSISKLIFHVKSPFLIVSISSRSFYFQIGDYNSGDCNSGDYKFPSPPGVSISKLNTTTRTQTLDRSFHLLPEFLFPNIFNYFFNMVDGHEVSISSRSFYFQIRLTHSMTEGASVFPSPPGVSISKSVLNVLAVTCR